MEVQKNRLILIGLLVLLVVVGALVYWGQYRRRTAELFYSGTIEAVTANLAFQVNGRVAEVLADEGQRVAKDQVLARLASEEFLARRDQAQADFNQAVETLGQLQAMLKLQRSALPADVLRSEAAVKNLEFQLKELVSGYRTQEVATTRLAMEEAQAALAEAEREKARYDRLYARNVVSKREKEDKDLRYETALKTYERASEAYEMSKEGFRKESIESARARLEEGRAALKQSRSNLNRIAATEKEVAAAGARVESAKAALELADIQLRRTGLTAPFDGIITSRNVEPGEVVSPGREVMSLADLARVDLKIFVDETEIGKVKPGQPVAVKIDTFPDKTYSGTVTFISPEGEFTPKIIQTHKERVKLVYRVKISVPNPNFELKPGMPADAWLR
jgi:HlyD family secretion protein